jgi:ribosomal protein S4|eukprot:COSAG06_NODE_495_length_15047_cov_11.349478_5_plen_102_part_00
MDNDQIVAILRAYEKARARERARYQEKLKDDPHYQEKNKARARAHYAKNKHKKREYYHSHREVINAKSLFRYYKRRGKAGDFKSKFPDKYELIKEYVSKVG